MSEQIDKTEKQSVSAPKAPQSNKNSENRTENREHKGGKNFHGGHRGNGHHSRNNYHRERNESGHANKENFAQRESGKNIADVPVKRSIQSQNNTSEGSAQNNVVKKNQAHKEHATKPTQLHENTAGEKEGFHTQQRNSKAPRNFQRDGAKPRSAANIKVEETREDIIRDIGRIEKEIELEIKEISALKIGM